MKCSTAHQSRDRSTMFPEVGRNNANESKADQLNYSATHGGQETTARYQTRRLRQEHIKYVSISVYVWDTKSLNFRVRLIPNERDSPDGRAEDPIKADQQRKGYAHEE